MRPRLRPLLAVLLALCLSAALVAGAAAATSEETDVVESLGIHYATTGFEALAARPDGSLLTLRGGWLESVLPDGAVDPNAPDTEAPAETSLYPAAGGKFFALGSKRLTRLDPDGSVDTSFGTAGTVEPPSGTGAVYELPSGEIALVSTVSNGAESAVGTVSVTYLNQDGSEAAGMGFEFTLGGYFSSSADFPVSEITPIAGGGALVVGYPFVFEIDPDGSLNRGFGKNGVVETFGLIGGDVLPDGSVEAVGTAGEGAHVTRDLELLRLTAAGQPETGFGPEGIRRFDFHGNQDEARVASWGADGSLIVGGVTSAHRPCPLDACEEAPLLAAFDAAGELEAGFGQGGWLELKALAGPREGTTSDAVSALARRPDGSIVAAGSGAPGSTNAFLAAFSAQGALLPGFGDGGIALFRRPLRAGQEVSGLVALSGGGLLGVGTTDVGTAGHPVMVRYGADDTLDRSLGAGAGFVQLGDQVLARRQPSGFAVAGGEALTAVYAPERSRLLMVDAQSGSPVASFGDDGTVDLPEKVFALSEAFGPGGDPVVLGERPVPGSSWAQSGVVLRYLPDGKLDRDFGSGGKFEMRLGGRRVRGKSMVVGPGGRTLVAGTVGHRFAIASLLPDGKLDRRFGHDGWAVVELGALTHEVALARVGSHIYLAGTVGEERIKGDLVLMRFDSDGRLDLGFGRRGMRSVGMEFWGRPSQVISTPAGILVVGTGGPLPLVTFGRDGKVMRRPVGSQREIVGDVHAAVAGKTLVLGWTRWSKENECEVFHLARRPLDRP